MSFLDQRELEMGRSALPHAAAWIQGAVSLSLDRFQLHTRVERVLSTSNPQKGGCHVPSAGLASWPVVPGEQLCTRLARSPAQSHLLPVPQGLCGFSVSSETLAPKSAQHVALALHVIDRVHSWTWCFALCPSQRRLHHKSASLRKPLRCSNGAPNPASYRL